MAIYLSIGATVGLAHAGGCDDDIVGRPSPSDVTRATDQAFENLRRTLLPHHRTQVTDEALAASLRRPRRAPMDVKKLNAALADALFPASRPNPIPASGGVDPERALFTEMTIANHRDEEIAHSADHLLDTLVERWMRNDKLSALRHRLYAGPFEIEGDFEFERGDRVGRLRQDGSRRMTEVRLERELIAESPVEVIDYASISLHDRADLSEQMRADLADALEFYDLDQATYLSLPSVARRARPWRLGEWL